MIKRENVVGTKNNQFKMYLTQEWQQRLRDAATNLKMRSSQEVIQDILDNYFDVYVAVKSSVDGAVRRHRVRVMDEVINESRVMDDGRARTRKSSEK